MTVRQNIARNIKVLRLANGMTQQDLADRLGLHRPAISEIEAMRRGVGIEECVEIAVVFGVGAEEIYGSAPIAVCPACGQSLLPPDAQPEATDEPSGREG